MLTLDSEVECWIRPAARHWPRIAPTRCGDEIDGEVRLGVTGALPSGMIIKSARQKMDQNSISDRRQ